MFNRGAFIVLVLSSAALWSPAASAASLEAPVTLPIVFTKTISAGHAHNGDPIVARTNQVVRLADGTVIPSGSPVSGHVVAAQGFTYDHTPYAHQKQGTLTVQFDAVLVHGASLPLKVKVRAMADPLTTSAAEEAKSTDLDSLATTTQIGGDQLTPSQSEVVDRNGDVVAYNKTGGVYAHLIARGNCDGSNVEVSVGSYSASACGLYGFTDVAATETGSAANPSTLTLVSTHASPTVWKHTTALLEVLPGGVSH